jgi:hypothetical protein
MTARYERTTELLKALSLLNRLDAIRVWDPENPERIYSGGESCRLKIRQELVQLADPKAKQCCRF